MRLLTLRADTITIDMTALVWLMVTMTGMASRPAVSAIAHRPPPAATAHHPCHDLRPRSHYRPAPGRITDTFSAICSTIFVLSDSCSGRLGNPRPLACCHSAIHCDVLLPARPSAARPEPTWSDARRSVGRRTGTHSCRLHSRQCRSSKQPGRESCLPWLWLLAGAPGETSPPGRTAAYSADSGQRTADSGRL